MITEAFDGEVLRYWVSSESRPGIRHLVDLAENDGLGQCSCEHFNMRLRPNCPMNGRRHIPSRRFQCKHIHEATWRLTQDIIQNEISRESMAKAKARGTPFAFHEEPDGGVPETEEDPPF